MRKTRIPSWFGVGMLIGSAAFVIGSVSHIPVRMGPIDEPKIIPATVVEGLCALALAIGGFAILRGSVKAWQSAMSASVFVACGVTLGVVRLAMGANPRTWTNDIFHYTSLVLLAGAIARLWSERAEWRIPPPVERVRTQDLSRTS